MTDRPRLITHFVALLICAVAGIAVAVFCGFTVSAVFGFELRDVFAGVLGLFR